MSRAENAIRAAANTLHQAITEGRAQGLTIAWPGSPEGLTSISISETARAASTAPTAPAKPRRVNQKVTK